MKKRILDYNKKIQTLLFDNLPNTNWYDVKKNLLVQIGFFQHERLVHLIVTITFALLEIISVFMILLTDNFMTIFLFLSILCLLIPYIKHYYLLENEVQKMYSYYDQINNLIINKKKPED